MNHAGTQETRKVQMVYIGRHEPFLADNAGHLWYIVSEIGRYERIDSNDPLDIEKDRIRQWYVPQAENVIVNEEAGIGQIYEFDMTAVGKMKVYGQGTLVGSWGHEETTASWGEGS